ncbi:hypothetical protein AGMMS49959_17140 [Planctomycetales bacterium]|nr:hypothetical protein AGMMS49959_17140 [Planctomycetales bacterium]
MEELDFYEVNADYINHLAAAERRVPRVDYSAVGSHNKFLCGVVLSVAQHRYFAPISSFTIPQRTNLIIKNERGKAISCIRFAFMIPVPPEAATRKIIQNEPSPKYRRLLNWELQFCRRNAAAIYSRAHFVYHAVVEKHDPLISKNCCDFKALEAACAAYAPAP